MLHGSHDHGAVCLCIAEHRPQPLELVRHHVHPLEFDGPDTPDNLVWLCPTTHYNVHEILRLFLKRARILSFYELGLLYEQTVNRYAYTVAVDGFTRIHQLAIPTP